MNDAEGTHVWFMRHGNTGFDYEGSPHDKMIDKLCNGSKDSLSDNHGIDFSKLPKEIDLICYSPAVRAEETAILLEKNLTVRNKLQMDELREVRFDSDIVSKQEYKSLANSRPLILTRWYENSNKTESFNDSMERVRGIQSFLRKRKEKNILFVTHGWFLRLLELYFVKQKGNNIGLQDLLDVPPVKLGDYVETKLDVSLRQIEDRETEIFSVSPAH